MLSYFKSSIGRKTLMGLSGLGLSGFVFTHMAANMFIIFSPKSLNLYTYGLAKNPLLLYSAEAGLVVMFLMHIACALSLTIENKRALGSSAGGGIGTRYAVTAASTKDSTLAAKTMMYSGTLLLAFLISHLLTFKYGPHYSINYDGVEMRDLYQLVVEVFKKPGYVLWYVVALLFLMGHMRHGVSSAFQSLGFNHPRYTPLIKTLGILYAVVVCGGFISQPLYVFFVK
jgi:succinate dehydrogenase / fumarate reductase cytochrome b subunit